MHSMSGSAHVEIQRERESHFGHRMWQYYVVLRQREDLPVIPVALVLYPEGEGIGLEEYTEGVLGRSYLTFRYLQISLPLLPAQEYVAAQSPLGAGLASVMRLPGDRAAQVALHLPACDGYGRRRRRERLTRRAPSCSSTWWPRIYR